MNILAFDTCYGACSAAVLRSACDACFEHFELRQSGHAERLIPIISAVMVEAGLAFSDLDRIAVTVGPGSFTGTRIGVAAARALAASTSLPVIGVTTLEVIAETFAVLEGDTSPPEVLVAIEARNNQVYAQIVSLSERKQSSVPALMTHSEAASLLPDAACTIVGSGAERVAALVNARSAPLFVFSAQLEPRAAILAQIAMRRDADAEPVRPLYLRPPDAKPQTAALLQRVAS